MDKYWIIGSSSGIGKALAKKLDNKGYKLILSSRSEDKLNELNNLLNNDHEVLPLDLSDKDQCLSISRQIVESNPDSLNIIFMSAAYSPDDYSDYENIINVNIMGFMHILHVTRSFMINSTNKSKLVICSSLVAYKGLPYSQPYII